jgi:hypothetical protein
MFALINLLFFLYLKSKVVLNIFKHIKKIVSALTTINYNSFVLTPRFPFFMYKIKNQ